jgi:hypothetical protein
MTSSEGRMSGFENGAESADSLRFQNDCPGQSYPQHYPRSNEPLGEPLSIRKVAQLIGCSEWTVRHRYLPQGIPHLRSGPMGKLMFFRNQVVRWILQQQRKGGK